MKFCSIDFEYHGANEKHPTLVSCVLKGRSFKTPLFFWLHNDPAQKAKLVDTLNTIKHTHTLLAYGASNEARCLLALGLNPLDWKWIDLFIEWRQLQNKWNKYLYGRVYKSDGNHIVSTPPNKPSPSHERVGDSLLEVLYFFFGVDLGGDHKDEMRDLILTGGPFTNEEARAILGYNAQDVEYLGMLFEEIRKRNKYLSPEIALRRGRYAACLSHSESLGIPLNVPRIESMSRHHDSIVERFILDLNRVYPFYIQDKKGKWTASYAQFANLIEKRGLRNRWPMTLKSKKYELNEDTFKRFENHPSIGAEVRAYMRARKQITNVGYFSSKRLPKFLERVGSDGRLRPYFNPFRSQTGRNQPPSSHFVFAMGAWLRCLIEPPPGHVILHKDWSAQEFAIAAILSGDSAMIAAYASGDPYLHYAKQTKAAPRDATRKTHGTIRDELKDSVLAIQFGSGAQGIANQMQSRTGKHYSKNDGARFLRMHKRSFPRYWEYLRKLERAYENGKPVATRDGWILWRDNPSLLSVRNFPMQGNGAACMRAGMINCWERGIPVISPLHDALYPECLESEYEDVNRAAELAMADACSEVLGDELPIRVGTNVHRHGEIWIEDRPDVKAIIESLWIYLDVADDGLL